VVSGRSPRGGVCVRLPPEATVREHPGHALASVVRTDGFSSDLPCRRPRDLTVAWASVTQLSCGPVNEAPSPAESSPWVDCAAFTIAPCVSGTASLHWRSIREMVLHRLKRLDGGYPARPPTFNIWQCRPLNPRLFALRFRLVLEHSSLTGRRGYALESLSETSVTLPIAFRMSRRKATHAGSVQRR